MSTDVWVELPATTGGGGGVSSLNGLTGALSLIAGTGISITPSGANITIANTEAGGTVTSVGLSLPVSVFTISGSPVTTSGTLTGTFTTQTANTFFSGPGTGSPATPTFRAITNADLTNITSLPALVLPASQLSGIVSIANGGTNNSTAYTAGSVIFSNGTSLTQDNANFFWNDTNHSLGISTNTPGAATFVDAVNSTAASKTLQLTGYGTGSTVGTRGRFARGTSGSPTAAQTGDIINFWSARGYGTTGFAATSTGAINAVAGENFTDTSMLTYISIMTAATGSVTAAESMRVTSIGTLIPVASTSALTINTTSFIFDSTNNALGIGGQPATNTFIDGINSSGAAKRIQLTGYGTGSNSGYRGRFARGTAVSPTAAQTGDTLAFFSGMGYGASQFPATSSGAINIIAGENFSNTSDATYINFQVAPTGSTTAAEAMRINSTGNVLIGTTTDSGTQKLQVNGNSNVGTVTAGVWNGTTVATANGGTGLTSNNVIISSFGITIDGGGSVITTGVKGYTYIPYGCTINSVTMLADQSGSIVVDIWKVPYASFPPLVANTITASDLPTISSAVKSQDTTLTGWTTAISAGDTLAFNVNSATNITRLNMILKVTKT